MYNNWSAANKNNNKDKNSELDIEVVHPSGHLVRVTMTTRHYNY